METDKHRYKVASLVSVLALACLFAGCKSDSGKIVFTDDGTLPQLPANSISPPKSNLAKAEEMKIELQVFAYLLSRHFWDDGGYSAIFLQGEESQVEALRKQFPDHVPPIKPDSRALLRPGLAPVDKDTGKLAVILSVDVDEPEEDGSVAAIGKWYAGGAVTGFYSFVLKKNGDDWEIQSGQ